MRCRRLVDRSGCTNLFGLTRDPKNPNWLDWMLGFCAVVIGLAFLVERWLRRGTAARTIGPDPLGTGRPRDVRDIDAGTRHPVSRDHDPVAADPITLARDLLRCPSVTPAEGGALALIEARR